MKGNPKVAEDSRVPIEEEGKKGPGRPPKWFKCKVFRMHVHPENADDPIKVNAVGGPELGGKRTFMPGEVTKLTRAHINILEDGVEDSRLEIPRTSDLYLLDTWKKDAEERFPEFLAEKNPIDGKITMVKHKIKYVVQGVE